MDFIRDNDKDSPGQIDAPCSK